MIRFSKWTPVSKDLNAELLYECHYLGLLT